MYVFGVWPGTRAGHFIRDERGEMTSDRAIGLPWPEGRLDGPLCPGYIGPYKRADETEGRAALHYHGGWTALAFWDRSEDRRGGCCCVFLAKGLLSGNAMVAACRERFPKHFQRFTFEVVIVERPSEVKQTKPLCSFCGKQGVGATLGDWTQDPVGWLRRGEQLACSPGCAQTETTA